MTRVRTAGLVAVVATGLVVAPGALSAPPSNDAFANATLLSGAEGTVSGTNEEATREVGEPAHTGQDAGASVWFRWTAPRSGTLLLDTCDSDFDTVLGVYTGADVTALTHRASNDDACEDKSALAVDVVGGTVYHVAVDGYAGATGTIVLWYAMTPTNDDFDDSQTISGEYGQTQGTLRWATHESAEPAHAGSAGTGSVWYVWSPPADRRAWIRVCAPGSTRTLVAVYAGAQLGSLTPLGAGETECSTPYVEFDAIAGTTYRIAVDTDDAADTFTLEWNTTPLLPRATTPPTINGSAKTNQVLVASPGTWVHGSSRGFAWYSCPEARFTAGCAPIRNLGPRPEELRVPSSAYGRRIVVEEYAIGPYGVSSAPSAFTPAVTAGPPVNVGSPDIDGESVVGRRLTAFEGEWDLGGAARLEVTYRWQACNDEAENCRDVKGPSRDNSYVVTSADLGRLIAVVVTMVTTGGSTSVSIAALDLVTRPVAAARCRVPRVVGKTLRAARASLTRSRCRLGKVQRVRSSRKRGVIVGQRPRPGTRLRVGSRVNLRVSSGRRR